MKSFKYISIVLVALLTLVGCKDKMRELNTDADLVDDTQVIYMFTGATQNFDWASVRSTANYMNELHKVMQYRVYYNTSATTKFPYLDLSDPAGTCPSYYDGICYGEIFNQSKGNRLNSILNYIDTQVPEADKHRYDDIYAITRGLLAYMQWRVFETYGASVYTEAFQAISAGNTQPNYDFIEEQYKDIDDEYKAAIQVLAAEKAENTVELGKQDYFAGWNVTANANGGVTAAARGDYDAQRKAWFAFFNMTRLEMAWKLMGVDASYANTMISECANYATQGAMFTKENPGFFFDYGHDLCCEDDMQEPESLHVVSDAFVNFLVANKDPRLPYMARPNGATENTSVIFNMMKEYFPDSLSKYGFLDGKHPYMGVSANPANKTDYGIQKLAGEPDPFLTVYTKSFKDLPNPKGTSKFVYECTIDGVNYSATICDQDKSKFDCGILVASENCNRYWVLCGARHGADHSYSGSGIGGLGTAYLSKLHSDGPSNDEGGQVGVASRCRIFTYAKQCFILASLGNSFGGKNAETWYKEGVQAAFDLIIDEAKRCKIQAWNGGESGFEYPSSVTQATPSGDWTITFPHVISQADIDAYITAHPFSSENLQDQIYAYGFLDPYFAYINYRISGYPQFKEHATAEEAAAEVHAYMEQPKKVSGEKYAMPRRGCLPDKTATNPNFTAAKAHLLAMPGFGNEWNNTNGGIWWEVPYMN